MVEEKEITTTQIYREDLNKVIDECKKTDFLRDKFTEIIKFWLNNKK